MRRAVNRWFPQMSASHRVFNADAGSFQSLVLDASQRVPVLVDFWAEWCGPCRALAPILEKLAEDYQGRFHLVKIDTDQEQEVAHQFGIRSLPTVKLFKDGAVVDEFLGALPESQVRAFLEGHLPRASDDARGRAKSLRDQGQLAQARALLEEARAGDPENLRVMADLMEVLIALGEIESAKALLATAPGTLKFDPELQKMAARLAFAEAAEAAPPPEALARAIEAEPRDCESRYLLGASHVSRGDYEAALEQFLEVLRIDRTFHDDAGRKALLSVFEMLGSDHPLVGRYRARMSSLLY